MPDPSANDRALMKRYWPDLTDPEQLREEELAARLVLARRWVTEEAELARRTDSWRKGAAARPVYEMPEWATNDAPVRTPGVDMPQEMADVLGAELPPAAPPRKKLGTAAVVAMIAMAVALLCCGAAASEGMRWLTEGIR